MNPKSSSPDSASSLDSTGSAQTDMSRPNSPPSAPTTVAQGAVSPVSATAQPRITTAGAPTQGQITQIRALAEQNSPETARYVDNGILLYLLDQFDQRAELEAKLATMTQARDAAVSLAGGPDLLAKLKLITG